MNLHSSPVKVARPLDKEQREFLTDQLRELKYSWRPPRRRESARVRKARAIIKAQNTKERRENERLERAFGKIVAKVREEMLFGDVRKALVLLRKIRGKK